MDRHRRRLLAALGTASVATLAGCTGGDEEDESGVDLTEPPNDSSSSTQTLEDSTPLTQQVAKLIASDGDERDSFGSSVAVSEDGSTAIIGAPRDEDPNGRHAGSVYVFSVSADNWGQQAKVTPDNGAKNDRFGSSVAVSNDGSTAIIGATGARSSYVYESSGGSWSQQAKVTPDNGAKNDRFGSSVTVSNDGSTAIIGSLGENNSNGESAGSAYVFEGSGSTWDKHDKIIADDGAKNDTFGAQVAVSGDGSTAIIGAPYGDNSNGRDAGSAYVFRASGGSWSQQAKLSADDGGSFQYFGWVVAVSGDGSTALIGATAPEAKSVYVFKASGGSWTQQTKFSTNYSDGFPSSVAMSSDGTTAIIGAQDDSGPSGGGAGAAYIFRASGGSWSQQPKLVADDGDSSDQFGAQVAVSGDGSTVIIGAPADEDPNGSGTKPGTGAGSAYVFNL